MKKRTPCFVMALVLAASLFVPICGGQTAYADDSSSGEPEEMLTDLEAPPVEEEAEEAPEQISGDGANKYAFDDWYDAAKTDAASADHILGLDGDILEHDYTLIMPGETIAILPKVGLSNYAVQGGISRFDGDVYKLDTVVIDSSFLVDSVAPNAVLTPVVGSERTLEVPFGDRVVDHPTDPVTKTEGTTSYTYYSLYKNTSEFPILIEKAQTGTKLPEGVGKNDNNATRFQSLLTAYESWKIYVLEKSYDIEYIGYKIGDGELCTSTSDFVAGWEELPVKILVDDETHAYSFPNPYLKNGRFEKWDDNYSTSDHPLFGSVDRGLFGEGMTKTVEGRVTTYTINFADLVSRLRLSNISSYSGCFRTQEIFLRYNRACTTYLDANGGTYGNQSFMFIEETTRYKNSNDLKNVLYGSDYKPTRSGYTFAYWCADPDNAAETRVTSRQDENAWTDLHCVLYAVWLPSSDVNGDGSTSSADLVALANFLSGDTTAAKYPDVNSDGEKDLLDLVALMKLLAVKNAPT